MKQEKTKETQTKPKKEIKTTVKKETNTKSAELDQELTQALQEVLEPEEKTPQKGAHVTLLPDGQLLIDEKPYALISDYRKGFDAEYLGLRFSEVLSRYDYIVGDWGHDQLRLKGFFDNENKRAFPDQKIVTLQDYLYEYCNFGCRYFVIEKMNKKKDKAPHHKTKKKNPAPTAFIAEKVQPVKKVQPVIHRQVKNTPEKEVPEIKTRRHEARIEQRAEKPTEKRFEKRNEKPIKKTFEKPSEKRSEPTEKPTVTTGFTIRKRED
ncbi:YutD family protein [Enterococcus timonensis]|uniref:YutD family protein n=1 Tax=Enterococcus timonensis TaxID=1852364 RepID=UPI0008D94908|nr:YutD family protein [Enterococcus timonensis]